MRGDHDCLDRQDRRAESGQGGLHQPGLSVRRVYKNNIEWAVGRGFVDEIANGVALDHTAALRDAGLGEVVADAPHGGHVPLDEYRPGRTARKGLYAAGARAREQVQYFGPRQVRLQDREEGLLAPIAHRTRALAGSEQPRAASATGNNAT